MRTLVIAEAASAHDGDFDKAKRLIDAAVDAGADVCKFQYFHDPDQIAARRRVPEYYRDVYRRYAIPRAWLPQLRDYCGDRIAFMCSTFLAEAVSVVEPFIQTLKVSAFEACDAVFVNVNLAFRKPVIVSVGMGGIPDHLRAGHSGQLRLLHCVSAYPTPFSALHLSLLHPPSPFVGLSDHTGYDLTGALAVAAGARIVEVHVRLEDTDPANPDAGPFALIPADLRRYVQMIRYAEVMHGGGGLSFLNEKGLQDCEREMLAYKVTA